MLSITFALLALFPAADDRAINDAPLYCVRFVDRNEGWAAGADGVMWHTIDSGQSWERQVLPTKGTIHALQFLTPYTGYAAGREEVQATGRSAAVLLKTTDGGLGWHRIDTPSIQGLDHVDFEDEKNGLVATFVGGETFRTNNGGATWVKSIGKRKWYDPKSRTHPNTPLPINAEHFIDDNQGWAVGELGAIWATSDAGKSWTPQRRGGQRTAIMCIHANDKSIPLDLVAALGGGDGYLIHCLTVTSFQDHAERSVRAATAVRKAGGAAAETFPSYKLPKGIEINNSNQLRDYWKQSDGEDKLTGDLVFRLRTWQPEVVICDFAGGPAETLVVEAVQTAVTQAADPRAFPEQIQVGRLSAWQVKKLYCLWDGPGAAHVTIRTSDPVPALGEAPRDYANRVVGLIAEPASLPKSRSLRLLANNLPNGAGQNGIMDGIVLAPGGTARRASLEVPRDEKDPNEQTKRELQNLANLAQSGLPQVGDPTAVMARVGQTLDKLPAEQGMNSLVAMAQQATQSGNWPLARETYELALNRYAGQPAGFEAMCWLMNYHSSTEARRRNELKNFSSFTKTEFASAIGKTDSVTIGNDLKAVPELTQASANVAVSRQWYQAAVYLEPKLAQYPQAANQPSLQFALAAAKRNLGDTDAGKGYYRKLLAEKPPNDPWRMAAKQELWVNDRTGEPPRFVANCRKTAKRPHLDAVFDDPCWADLPSVNVSPNDLTAGYATTARFAFDDEYLYIALECQHSADSFKPKVEHRARDADLSPYDHVDILFDLDRNYATYYRFRIDQRGALADDCWGDSKWNPRWYVAFKSSPEGYAAEISIPLSDLTGEPIRPARVWAMNLVRVVPGRGVSAASLPADVVPRPEGCGLLLFTDDKK